MHLQCRRYGFDPSWVRKIPWRRKQQPTLIFLLEIPWIEEPGRLQSMGCKRVGHNWVAEQQLQMNFNCICHSFKTKKYIYIYIIAYLSETDNGYSKQSSIKIYLTFLESEGSFYRDILDNSLSLKYVLWENENSCLSFFSFDRISLVWDRDIQNHFVIL